MGNLSFVNPKGLGASLGKPMLLFWTKRDTGYKVELLKATCIWALNSEKLWSLKVPKNRPGSKEYRDKLWPCMQGIQVSPMAPWRVPQFLKYYCVWPKANIRREHVCDSLYLILWIKTFFSDKIFSPWYYSPQDHSMDVYLKFRSWPKRPYFKNFRTFQRKVFILWVWMRNLHEEPGACL